MGKKGDNILAGIGDKTDRHEDEGRKEKNSKYALHITMYYIRTHASLNGNLMMEVKESGIGIYMRSIPRLLQF